MYPDVVDLREFYESELGELARRLVRERLRMLWPNLTGATLLGLGYATPYLRPFLHEAQRCFAFMPAPQGITWWPREGPNATALIEETTWPLADCTVDRVIFAHALENTEQMGALLQEAHRVLSNGGRMIVVVPNRSGWWAHENATPFGFGFSFSLPHIKRILVNNHFQIERHARALFMPPFAHRFFARSADWLERHGLLFLPALAGVLLIEVSRQAYARPLRAPVRVARPALLPIPGFAQPAASKRGGS